MKRFLFFAGCLAGLLQSAPAQVYLAGMAPGKASARQTPAGLTAYNHCLSARWQLQRQQVTALTLTDKQSGQTLRLNGRDWFRLLLKNGDTLSSATFEFTETPRLYQLQGMVRAPRAADRLAGIKFVATLLDRRHGISLRWEAVLRDSCNYLRQSFAFSAASPVEADHIALLCLPARLHAQTTGTTDGAPLVWASMFFGIEHPLSQTDSSHGYTACMLSRQSPITATDSFTTSAIWGVTPAGQLRRGFLYYVEKERALPYRPFLHYNSWFDISWADRKLGEDSCLDRIQTYADSLITKRQTPMNAFLFDDGWDDNQTLWQFNKGFPRGFTPLQSLAARYHSQLGVWISPWGGYDEAKQQRLRYGRQQDPPFEINGDGFSLAGPHYYQRFYSVAKRFVTGYGVRLFKYDGIGSIDGANGTTSGSGDGKEVFRKDFEAMLRLVSDLRAQQPDLYFSLTIGTWPSPFWLRHADNIWRSGWDNGQAGTGPKRQQWLNFRDGELYRNIVLRAPLYPLNAVMNHGICIAANGLPAQYEMDDKNVSDEIWSFFATGTSLQELYINPHKLNTAQWDCLAAAIHWARSNAAVMPDVHWIGGNPLSGDVYGYAAWTPAKAVLSLRNPSARPASFTISAAQAFQLPAAYRRQSFAFYPVNKGPVSSPLYVGQTLQVTLAPYEVIVFDARPQGKTAKPAGVK